VDGGLRLAVLLFGADLGKGKRGGRGERGGNAAGVEAGRAAVVLWYLGSA